MTLIEALMNSFPGAQLPQNFMGTVQLAKAAARHPIDTAKSLKIDPSTGALIYNDPSIDSPAAAMGQLVAVKPGVSNDPDVLKHELRHVSQSAALGPAYLPTALVESLMSKYGEGALENDAIRHATPQALPELVPNDPNKDSLMRKYLLSVLGK
jgi:hypothetical protein